MASASCLQSAAQNGGPGASGARTGAVRHASARHLEAIAGIVDHGDPDACVHREVMEEAQLTLDSLEPLFTGWTMPGISTERMHFYLGVYSSAARPETKGGVASEGESTTAVEIGLGELARMVDANALPDAKTLVLVQTLRLRRPDLF